MMRDALERWLFDPVVGRFVTAAIGVAIVYTVARLLRRSRPAGHGEVPPLSSRSNFTSPPMMV